MIHETLHMLDFESGVLSDQYRFQEVYDHYEYLLKKWYSTSEKKLTGKYNLSYYLEPTEVFARCGEIYFARICGVRSSLLGNARGFAYPEDELLLEKINKYYEPLLKRRK